MGPSSSADVSGSVATRKEKAMLRKILKWVGVVLGGLIGLIVLALAVVLARRRTKQER